MGLFVGMPSYWLAFVRDWGGNVRGLLLAGMAFASRGEPHSLSSTQADLKPLPG